MTREATRRSELRRRTVLAAAAVLPSVGCAPLLGSARRPADSGLDSHAISDQVDRDLITWSVVTEHFAISRPVARTYPPVTLLVQGPPQPIRLGAEMAPYTNLDQLRQFADRQHIERVDDTPNVWSFHWVERAQGPMVFETGFVVADDAHCPANQHGYRLRRVPALKVCSIVYRGPYPQEPGSGWNEIRWEERARQSGFVYTERLYRELYHRHGGKRPRRPHITVIELSIA